MRVVSQGVNNIVVIIILDERMPTAETSTTQHFTGRAQGKTEPEALEVT